MRVNLAIALFLCVGVTGCMPTAPSAPAVPAAPMRYPAAAFMVTYKTPVNIAFTSSVTQNWSTSEGRPVRYRATMMQGSHNGSPSSPGRVKWEFAGTVTEGDVYVVRIHPDMGSSNATILPIIYSGTQLEILNDQTLSIRIADTGGTNQVQEHIGTGAPNSQH